MKQFRSPAEFTPHALWLLQDSDLDQSNCKCKYCSGGDHPRGLRRQSTSVRSATSVQTQSHSPPPRAPRHTSPYSPYPGRPADSPPTQRSQRGISRQVSLCEVFPQQGIPLQRTPVPSQLSDLTAYTQGRIYRDQELVWYILDTPWQVPQDTLTEVDCIASLWPGVIRTTSRPSSLIAGAQQSTENHHTFYLVATPSLERTYVVPQESLIPFRAYSPGEDLLVGLRSKDAQFCLDNSGYKFDPLPRFSTLIASLSKETETSPLDWLIREIRIAKQVACIWTVTDKLPAGADQNQNPTAGPLSLGQLSSEDSAMRPSSRSSSVGKTGPRYSGLWWGAERIWTGDLLTLSITENKVGYTVASSACFVQDAQSEDYAKNSLLDQRRPEDRHIFLKLESLNKVGADIYAIGDLYRLVPSFGSLQQDVIPQLPHPPSGFTFRRVLSTGIGAKLPIKVIAGRYYPRVYLPVNDTGLVPDQLMLKMMEGCGGTDRTTVRPTKYKWESRRNLFLNISSSAMNQRSHSGRISECTVHDAATSI